MFLQNTRPVNLRSSAEFNSSWVYTVGFGTESMSFMMPKIWELIPKDIKNASTIETFKQKRKLWKATKFPFRL